MNKLLRITDVCELTGLSRAKVYELLKAGKLPAPVQVPGLERGQRWRASDLDAWINAMQPSA